MQRIPTVVPNPDAGPFTSFDLLRQYRFDIHARLIRFARYLDAPAIGDIIDVTGAYPVYLFYVMAPVLVPFLLLISVFKVSFPVYFSVWQPEAYCSLPLVDFLTFRVVLDFCLWTTMLMSVCRMWRLCALIDLPLAFASALIAWHIDWEAVVCPSSLTLLTRIHAYFSAVIYLILCACACHRWWRVPVDETHPAWGPIVSGKDEEDDDEFSDV
jgi:hypothetical protein